MYVIICGAGKVGWNLARELIAKDREVTLVESDHARYRVVEEELEHAVQYGDATELWVLERAGIQRADLVIAVTGDDEDNILICQMAKEKYGVQRIVARVNNPRNLQHFRLLDVQPAVSATDLILRLIEHEVPEYGLVQLLALEEEHLEIIELEVGQGSEAAGRRVQDVELPDGSLIISVLRGGAGFVPKADSVIQPGDQVLLILDPGLEAQITPQFAPNGASAGVLMADRHVDYALIGGGLAAGNCARWLRESGADGSILLIGREADLPYNRPPCSKGYLQDKESRAETLFRPPDWYEEQSIEALTRVSAKQLDIASRTVALTNGQEVRFDKALIATGAGVRRISVPGAELEGIHYLRTLGNSDAIREDAAGKRVVLIGGSYIATEVAASLTELGSTCSLVMLEPVALSRGFGEQAGRFFQQRLEEHGVEVYGDDELDSFDGAGGRVTHVVTKRGRRLEADVVVIGVGAVPDVRLSRTAGLEIGERGGVVVDSRLQTSVPGIFAAGDIAEYDSVVHGGQSAADRALGRRLQPGQDRGAQHARPGPAPRRRAVLLLRSVRLGLARVRRPGLGMGPGGRSRLDRRGRVHDLLPARRARRRGADRRALGRPRARRPAAERRRRPRRPCRRAGDLSSDLESL